MPWITLLGSLFSVDQVGVRVFEVNLFTLWADGVALGVKFKAMTVFTHPANMTGGVADHKCIIRDMLGYHSPRADKGKTSDIMPAYNSRIGAYAGPLANPRLGVLTATIHRGTWVGYVGKNTGRAKENIVIADDPGVQTHIVLNLNIIP